MGGFLTVNEIINQVHFVSCFDIKSSLMMLICGFRQRFSFCASSKMPKVGVSTSIDYERSSQASVIILPGKVCDSAFTEYRRCQKARAPFGLQDRTDCDRLCSLLQLRARERSFR